jgi:SMC interacting uncharacterized protein involved in chromosome segregation
MMIKRTPPPSPATAAATSSSGIPARDPLSVFDQHASTSGLTRTAISLDDLANNITKRTKRKYESGEGDEVESMTHILKDLFSSFSQQFEKRFDALHESVKQISDQSNEMQKNLSFMSEKYDQLLIKMQYLEAERTNDRKYMQNLEDKSRRWKGDLGRQL